MAVKRDRRMFDQRLHDWWPERQVGHEMPIHHVDVQPVRALTRRASHPASLVGQVRQIGREHTRDDQRRTAQMTLRIGPGGRDHGPGYDGVAAGEIHVLSPPSRRDSASFAHSHASPSSRSRRYPSRFFSPGPTGSPWRPRCVGGRRLGTGWVGYWRVVVTVLVLCAVHAHHHDVADLL